MRITFFNATDEIEIAELPPILRGPQGEMAPADQARIDAASDVAATITARMDEAVSSARQATGAANTATTAAGTAVTDAGRAEAAAATASASANALSNALSTVVSLEDGTQLADGSRRIMSVKQADGRHIGDLIRLVSDGLVLKLAQATQDNTLATGRIALGPQKSNGGRDLIRLDGVAGPIAEVMPDGLNVKASRALWDQIPADMRGGGEVHDGWSNVEGRFTAQAGQHGVNATDRFIHRADGVRLPVAVINGQTRKATIISVYGQSLGDVTRMADPLVWGTPPLPFHAFMIDDMNAFGSGTHRGGIMGWQGVAVQRGARMINASEAARDCQSYASAAFARLVLWDGPLRRVGMIRSSAWGGNPLVGTSAGSGIWRDSVGAYTQSWINWTGDIQQSHDLLTAAGYQVDKIYILFSHQEADWQTPRATYLSNLLAMKSEREAICASAFPSASVQWFCDQASGSGLRTGSYLGGRWQSRLAIVDACKPENGGNNITLVTPRYWLRTGNEFGVTGNPNVIHHRHDDRPIWGEAFAHAMRAKEMGREWRCPLMSSATINGTSVIVNFDSILPITIDPTFCKVRSDGGFTINEGAIPVLMIDQTGQRQITLTCASAPAPGSTVEYAWRQQDGSDIADEWVISTGAIRDAWTAPSEFDPYGRTIYRPALGYQITAT